MTVLRLLLFHYKHYEIPHILATALQSRTTDCKPFLRLSVFYFEEFCVTCMRASKFAVFGSMRFVLSAILR